MSAISSDPMLVMRGVTKSFGAVRALQGVELCIEPGEVHALVGENGAGKSTLMKILSGAEQPDAGEMWLAGKPYAPRNPRQARQLGVAMIYQELTLAPHLSVAENILLGQEATFGGLAASRRNRKLARSALETLGYADLPLSQRAGTLGLAARQIIEIARALVSEARVIVFDEPTSVLTEVDAKRLFEVIAKLASRGIAVVYISHFLEEVQKLARRFTVLRDGKSVGTGQIADASLDSIVRLMVGRALSEMFPRVAHTPGAPLLELSALSGETAPRNVNLALRRGEILGLAGLVGAGRSELLRCIYGLEPVRSGVIRVAQHECTRRRPHQRIRQGFGLLSEDRKGEGLSVTQSIEDNITFSNLDRYAWFGWINPGRRRRAAVGHMNALRLRAAGPGQAVSGLSGGNQQKVAIARLLEQEADVLLFDEPTRGIDVGSKVEIYQKMGELAARGKGVLMASSYLPELLGVCDRIAVMRRGMLCEVREASQWNEHEIMSVAIGV